MMQKPILSGRLGKWAYSLVEYDLEYEPLRATKAQIVADFIVDHGINVDDVYSVTISP
jgi:ribonuclease HI